MHSELFCIDVPKIGVEPTCREALAPETSVSTISPLGQKTECKYTTFFKKYTINPAISLMGKRRICCHLPVFYHK